MKESPQFLPSINSKIIENNKPVENINVGIECVDTVNKINNFILERDYPELSREEAENLLKIAYKDISQIDIDKEVDKILNEKGEESFNEIKNLPYYIQGNYLETEITKANEILIKKGIKIDRETFGVNDEFNFETQELEKNAEDSRQYIFCLDDSKKMLEWLSELKKENISDEDKERLQDIFINIKDHINPSGFARDEDKINEFIEITRSIEMISENLTRLGISVHDLTTNPVGQEFKDYIEPLKNGYIEEYVLVSKSFLFSTRIGPASWPHSKKIDEIEELWNDAFETLSNVSKNPKATILYEKLYDHLAHSLEYSLAIIPGQKKEDTNKNSEDFNLPYNDTRYDQKSFNTGDFVLRKKEGTNKNSEVVPLLAHLYEKLKKDYLTKDIENRDFSSEISSVVNSQPYLVYLHKYPESKSLGSNELSRSDVIGSTIEYSHLVSSNGADVFRYLEDCYNSNNKENIRTNILISHIAKKLDIENINEAEGKNKIFKYFNEHYEKDGYYYHGFNGAFKKSIIENGLNPNTRFWDWNDLKEINNILTPAGIGMGMGWGFLNSVDKVSLSDTTENTYRYAAVSPEWFAQFVCEGFHIPHNDSNYDKKAFNKRDYPAARKNIDLLCESLMSRKDEDIIARKAYPNITAIEKNKILDFFEKYWKIFASKESDPKVALVKRTSINRSMNSYDSFESFKTEMDNRGIEITSLEDAVDLMISSREHDGQFKNTISAEDIKIVDLPDYRKVME